MHCDVHSGLFRWFLGKCFSVEVHPYMTCFYTFWQSAFWASVSEPHTSVFNCTFVCAYGVRTYVRPSVRTHIPHIVSRFTITFQIVSVIFQIVHVATVAAVQLA